MATTTYNHSRPNRKADVYGIVTYPEISENGKAKTKKIFLGFVGSELDSQEELDKNLNKVLKAKHEIVIDKLTEVNLHNCAVFRKINAELKVKMSDLDEQLAQTSQQNKVLADKVNVLEESNAKLIAQANKQKTEIAQRDSEIEVLKSLVAQQKAKLEALEDKPTVYKKETVVVDTADNKVVESDNCS